MPSNPDLRCPRCHSRRLVLGELAAGRTIGQPEPVCFRAFSARYSSVRMGAPVSSGVFACAMCGLLWGEVVPGKLADHLS